MARRSGSSGERTAEELRRAALHLFAEHGYAAVSMRQIAARVGVQAGALYLYTPDKQTLLADILTAHMEELLASWAQWPKPGGGDAAARFECFVRFHIRHHMERGAEVFISYMELRNLAPENFARIEVLRRSYEAELTEILRDGCAAGLFRLAGAEDRDLCADRHADRGEHLVPARRAARGGRDRGALSRPGAQSRRCR